MAYSFIELDRLWSMWSVWLVFCDCGFHSACPLRDKVKRLPDGRDWLWGKLGLVLMGGAMPSKSLIQFSLDGWGCVPSLLFTWGQIMVEVMKKMQPPLKDPLHVLLHVPSPAARHHHPTPPLETPGHSQASLGRFLVGSLLLSPRSSYTRFSLCPPVSYIRVFKNMEIT